MITFDTHLKTALMLVAVGGSTSHALRFLRFCVPSNMFTVSAAAVAGATQGTTPPVKPKRKKPGTAIKRKVQPITVDAKGNKEGMRGSVIKWFRVLDLKFGGSWFKSSTLLLHVPGFDLSSPELNSSAACVNS